MRYDSNNDTTRYDKITIRCDTARYDALAHETIRYEADTIQMRCDTLRYTIRIRCETTRYTALVRDNDGSPSPDRVREPIKFEL